VEFGELHAFVGEDFVVTVRHGKASTLNRVRRRLESVPELLCRGSEAVLYAIMDRVVDDYVPVVAGLEQDVECVPCWKRGAPRLRRVAIGPERRPRSGHYY
jgi:magnesium transporter